MPKDTIEKAIIKGTGELGGENYEAVTYEGYGPGGVAMMIEALTNNRARTAPEIRAIFEGPAATSPPAARSASSSPARASSPIKTDAVAEETCWKLPWMPAPRTSATRARSSRSSPRQPRSIR